MLMSLSSLAVAPPQIAAEIDEPSVVATCGDLAHLAGNGSFLAGPQRDSLPAHCMRSKAGINLQPLLCMVLGLTDLPD